MSERLPDDLSPSARELFRAARPAALPSSSQRARSLVRLGILRQSAGPKPVTGTLSLEARKGRRGWRLDTKTKLLLAAAVLLTAGSAAAVRRTHFKLSLPHLRFEGDVNPRVEGRRPTSAPVVATPAEAPEPTAAPNAEVSSSSPHRPRILSAPTASQRDDMDDELTMLTKARQALAAGQSSDALRFLAEDTRRFPNSAFGEERAFTRIRALCELGRVTEARAEGERFTRQWPSSVYTSGVRRSCALTGREASGSSP